MEKHFILFAWEIILREAKTFLLEEWIIPSVFNEIHEHYNNLIKEAADKIDNIVESLNVPVHALPIPIANNYVKYNEKSYEGEVINAKM